MFFGKKKVIADVTNEEPIKKKPSLKMIGLITVVGILVIAFIIFSIIESKKVNYYDTMNSIITNELGSFKFVIDVRTDESGKLIKVEDSQNLQVSDLEKLEAGIKDTEDDDKDGQKNEFTDWTESADYNASEWKYPNYKITIEGCTTSVEPLTTYFTVHIATEYYNSLFTEVTCVDGNYYINIEAIQDWLVSSKDGYLFKLGKDLQKDYTYLVIPEKELNMYSRYAERSELEDSIVNGLPNQYKRFSTMLSTIISLVKDNIGNGVLDNTFEDSELTIDGANATKMVNVIKSLVNKRGDFYTSMVEKYNKQGLFTEKGYKQALNEKDNFVGAFEELSAFLTTANSPMIKIEGHSREYVNGSGYDCKEAITKIGISTQETDYLMQITCVRTGAGKEIKVPNGTTLKYENFKTKGVFLETIYSMLDYFNFTSIKLENKLELSAETIADNMLTDFIRMINESGHYNRYLTKSNFDDFLKKYANYEVTNQSTADEIACSEMVDEFFKAINDLTSDVIKEENNIIDDSTKYPEITVELNGVKIEANVNLDESTSKLLVVDMELINKSENIVTLNATNFKLYTKSGSMYPANNEILLLGYNSNFDTSKLTTSVELQPKYYDEFKLYFVISDRVYTDLYYNDTILDVIITD